MGKTYFIFWTAMVQDHTMSMMKVTTPSDETGMSFAVEAIITEAFASGMTHDEIQSVLELYSNAARRDDYPFNEYDTE